MNNYVTDDIQVVNEGTTHPFLVCDNWFSPEEEKAVWSELNFYSHQDNINRAGNTIVATDSKGRPKSNAYRWYTAGYYKVGQHDFVSHIDRY